MRSWIRVYHPAVLTDLLLDALIYVVFPTALGVAAAFAFWMKRRILLGNAVGSGVIAVVMVLFILQRFAAFTSEPATPGDPISPMLVLALLGWLDVFIVFILSGFVEDRVKKRVVNPNDF